MKTLVAIAGSPEVEDRLARREEAQKRFPVDADFVVVSNVALTGGTPSLVIGDERFYGKHCLSLLRNHSVKIARFYNYDRLIVADADSVFVDIPHALPLFGTSNVSWCGEHAQEVVWREGNVTSSSWFCIEPRAFEAIGAEWNESYIGWGYEDIDLVARLWFNGVELAKSKINAVHMYHPRPEATPENILNTQNNRDLCKTMIDTLSRVHRRKLDEHLYRQVFGEEQGTPWLTG